MVPSLNYRTIILPLYEIGVQAEDLKKDLGFTFNKLKEIMEAVPTSSAKNLMNRSFLQIHKRFYISANDISVIKCTDFWRDFVFDHGAVVTYLWCQSLLRQATLIKGERDYDASHIQTILCLSHLVSPETVEKMKLVKKSAERNLFQATKLVSMCLELQSDLSAYVPDRAFLCCPVRPEKNLSPVFRSPTSITGSPILPSPSLERRLRPQFSEPRKRTYPNLKRESGESPPKKKSTESMSDVAGPSSSGEVKQEDVELEEQKRSPMADEVKGEEVEEEVDEEEVEGEKEFAEEDALVWEDI